MIALTFALPAESSAFLRLLADKIRCDRGGVYAICGKIDNREIEILHTGVGRKFSEQRMALFLQDRQFDYLISAGFAGALREDLQVGDLVLAENFSDPHLLSIAQPILTDRKMHVAKLFTSNAIIESVDQRNKIAAQQNAVAVDMETETIAQVCRAPGIPVLSLRVVSDSLREPFPAPPNVLFDIERQRTDIGRLLLYLLRHPGAVWPLIRFARQTARARKVLTNAIVDLIRKLSS